MYLSCRFTPWSPMSDICPRRCGGGKSMNWPQCLLCQGIRIEGLGNYEQHVKCIYDNGYESQKMRVVVAVATELRWRPSGKFGQDTRHDLAKQTVASLSQEPPQLWLLSSPPMSFDVEVTFIPVCMMDDSMIILIEWMLECALSVEVGAGELTIRPRGHSAITWVCLIHYG